MRLNMTMLGDSGPRIVFLHGLFGQGRNWTQIAKALASKFRVTLVDLPDHGQSPWSTTFSYGAMADDLAADLREVGGGEEFAVVGHSMGGKVAMLLALRHPELVERLVVVDMSPVSYGGLRTFGKYVNGMRAVPLDSITSRAQADKSLQTYVDDATIRGFLLQNLRREGGAFRWQMNLDLLGKALPQLGDWPTVQVSPEARFDGPVLWIAGAESTYVKPEFGEVMRGLFPRTQLVTVKKAGHWVHSEKPQIFTEILRRFLESQRARPANCRPPSRHR